MDEDDDPFLHFYPPSWHFSPSRPEMWSEFRGPSLLHEGRVHLSKTEKSIKKIFFKNGISEKCWRARLGLGEDSFLPLVQ